MKIRFLSKKEIKNLVKNLSARNDVSSHIVKLIEDSEQVKVIDFDKFSLIVADSRPVLFSKKTLEIYIPTLFILNTIYAQMKVLAVPTVIVDEGAVGPITRGADVMAPGIASIEREFDKDNIVAVMEPGKRYLIAVGIALMNAKEVIEKKRGKAIKNLNWLNDDIWNACIEIARKAST